MSIRKKSRAAIEEENVIVREPDNVEVQVGENFFITFRRKKPFTKRQIENIEKYFGFKVKNL